MAWLDASVGRLSIHVFSVFENTKYLYFYNAYVLNLSLVWVWTEMWNTPHFQRAQWPLEYIWRQIRNTKIHYRCKTPLSPPVQWEPPWIAVLLWGPPIKENWWSSLSSWFPFWSENAFLVSFITWAFSGTAVLLAWEMGMILSLAVFPPPDCLFSFPPSKRRA